LQAFIGLFQEIGEAQIGSIDLTRETDGLPPDTYLLHEYYCTDAGCDCRNALIHVYGRRSKKRWVSILVNFDGATPEDGPLLSVFGPSSDGADAIVRLFMSKILAEPDYLARLHEHYRMVKTRVDREPYRGAPFHVGPPRLTEKSKKRFDWHNLTEDDRSMVESLIQEVVTLWQKETDDPDNRMDAAPIKSVIQANPLLAFPLIELLIRTYAPNGRDREISAEYDACMMLLEEALIEIRYGMERNREWAIDTAREIQDMMAEQAFRLEVDVRVQSDLLQVLHRSHLVIQPNLKVKTEELAEYYNRFTNKNGGADIDRVFESLAEEFEGEPFSLFDRLLAEMSVMHEDAQVSLILQMFDSDIPLIQELLPFHFLHPNEAVRKEICAMAAESVHPSRISEVGLRRLIGLRNWLPKDERRGLDETVKQIRRGRIGCAPMPSVKVQEAVATPIDGSSAQGFMVLSKGAAYQTTSILIRHDMGIRDVWVEEDLSRKEAFDILSDIQSNGMGISIRVDYINRIISHVLHGEQAAGRVPPPLMLLAAERMGCAYWHPAPLDFAEAHKELQEAARPRLSTKFIDRTLDESREWPLQRPFAVSWFEDDQQVEEIIDRVLRFSLEPDDFLGEAMACILDEVLEPKRRTWHERLIWMSLWARHLTVRAPIAWQKLFIVARALNSDIPLHEIPMMLGVAEQSVAAAMKRRHTSLFHGNHP